MCLSVQTLTSPPVLKLWDIQRYLWLPYDLTQVMKLIGERFDQIFFFFFKKYFISFLPHYCHSFCITVIPSRLLSFLPDFVIPSVLKLLDSQGYLWLSYDLAEVIKLIGVTFKQTNIFFSKKYFMSFFHISVIPSVLMSFPPDYCHSFRIIVIPSVLVSFLPNYSENYKY